MERGRPGDWCIAAKLASDDYQGREVSSPHPARCRGELAESEWLMGRR